MINFLRDKLINLTLLIGANVILLFLNVFEGLKLREYSFLFYAIVVLLIGISLIFNNDAVKRKIFMLLIGINIMAYPSIKGFYFIVSKGQHIIIISLMVLFILFVLVFIMVRRSPLDNETTNIVFELIKGLFNKNEIKNNTVIIAKDKITGKDLTLNYKDMMLHMLILGPTGCGKTSQIIMPMSEQLLDDKTAGFTVIEPKEDLAKSIYAMARLKGRKVVYFNPAESDCPTFNPLNGDEQEVIESMVSVFATMYADSPSFFKDANEELLRKGIALLKRTMGDKGTFIDLYELLTGNKSLYDKFNHHCIENFNKTYDGMSDNQKNTLLRENRMIKQYFIEYFKSDSKTFEHTSNVKTNLSKLISNKDIRRVLCPEDGKSELNFKDHVDRVYGDGKGEQTVYALTSNQGKFKALGSYIGKFLIYSFQNEVFNRSGNEDERMPHFFFVDEIQEFVNDSITILFNQGRSYRVSTLCATQDTGLVEAISPKINTVIKTNCRNRILFPAIENNDVKYFSEKYGTMKQKQISNSRTTQGISLFSRQQHRPDSFGKSITEVEKARIDANIFYEMDFGEVLVERVVNNKVSYPRVGKISYIDEELKSKIERLIKEDKGIFDLT